MIGSCLCGTVRYELSGPHRAFVHCHCSICRKHHGSLFSSNVAVDPEHLRWLEGEDSIVRYRSSKALERAFCRHCGSIVPIIAGDLAFCPAGALSNLDMKPQAHIFVASKSPSDKITDSLPQFPEYPPGYGRAVPGPQVPPLTEGVVQGSCLCGEVAFEFDDVPRRMVNCHCSRCRISRGAAHATNVFARSAKFRWTRRAGRVRTYKVPDAEQFTTTFCERCGSLLPSPFEKIRQHLVPVGSLDTPLGITPTVNIYVASKTSWFDITDGLPQFDELPPLEQRREFLIG
ncbi:MAG TPA: GFA family protein [Steroidobacteraceae bacterium]